MKKLLTLFACIAVALSTVGCGSNNSSNSSSDSTESEQKTNNLIEKDEGTYELISEKKGVNIAQKRGTINFTINDIDFYTFKPNEYFKNMYKDKDELICIEMNITLENESESEINIMPSTSKIIPDSGYQVEADPLSDAASISDLAGKSKAGGKLRFYAYEDFNSLKHFKMTCNKPLDLDGLAETQDFNFDINIK